MPCPYLKLGKVQNYCEAYLGRLMVPSQYEEEYFCNASLYRSCVWYEAALKEVMAPSDSVACPEMGWMANRVNDDLSVGTCA